MTAINKHKDIVYNEKIWIEQIQNGDTDSFKKMVITYSEPLCIFAYRIVQRSDVAEDLVQDLFVKIWESRDNWEPLGTIKAYLFKAVRNKAINYLDHQKVKIRLHSTIVEQKQFEKTNTESTTEKLFKDKAFVEELQEAIKELPNRTKLVYTLHRQDGFKYSEIAWIMGISQKTVESHMTRALISLRDKLKHFSS